METCGDGVLDLATGEECEDGNLTPGDGCTAGCKIEDGWDCDNDPLPSSCFAVCGDEIIVPSKEGCDDGDTDGTSGCNGACSQAVLGWECDPVTGGKDSCNPICGDTLVVTGEACDDGNPDSGDGCSAACALESTCPNGIVEPGEECDGDGPGLDECNANCKLLDPALAVCKDAPLIPQGTFNIGTGPDDRWLGTSRYNLHWDGPGFATRQNQDERERALWTGLAVRAPGGWVVLAQGIVPPLWGSGWDHREAGRRGVGRGDGRSVCAGSTSICVSIAESLRAVARRPASSACSITLFCDSSTCWSSMKLE